MKRIANQCIKKTNVGEFGIRKLSKNGSVIVFVHGWMHSSLIWSRIPQSLLDDHTVVTVDLPGFGGCKLTSFDAGLEGVGNALISVLMDLKKEHPLPTIVADSLGALLLISSSIADHLERRDIRSLILSGTPFEGVGMPISLLPPIIPLAINIVRVLPSFLGRRLVSSNVRYTVRLRSALEDEIYQSVLQAQPKAAAYYLRRISKAIQVSKQFEMVIANASVTLLRGQFDRIVSRSITKKWAKILHAAEVEIPGVGHTPMIEAAEAYYAIVVNKAR